MIVFVYGNGGIDTSDLNHDELGILSFLKRFAPGSANENLKIFAKILTVGSKLIDYFPTDNPHLFVSNIEDMINKRITNTNLKSEQAEQLTKAYQIITKNR